MIRDGLVRMLCDIFHSLYLFELSASGLAFVIY
jgi:hypothetical protein